jgi:hypothetical protein
MGTIKQVHTRNVERYARRAIAGGIGCTSGIVAPGVFSPAGGRQVYRAQAA